MLKVRAEVEMHIRWFVGKSGIIAGRDKWLSSAINHQGADKEVCDLFFPDGSPNGSLITLQLGSETLHEIRTQGISLSADDDHCIRSLTSIGTFSFSSAWELLRQITMTSLVAKCCWHPNLQTKVFVFLWKLLQNGLPTDLGITKKRHHNGLQMSLLLSCT